MFDKITTEFDKTRNRITHILATQGKIEDTGDGLYTVTIRAKTYKRVRKLIGGILDHDDDVMAQIALALFFEFKHKETEIKVYIGDVIAANEADDFVVIDAIESLLDVALLIKILNEDMNTMGSIATRDSLLKFR